MMYIPYVGCGHVVRKKKCDKEMFGFHYRPTSAPRPVCAEHMTQSSGYTIPNTRTL